MFYAIDVHSKIAVVNITFLFIIANAKNTYKTTKVTPTPKTLKTWFTVPHRHVGVHNQFISKDDDNDSTTILGSSPVGI